MVTQLLSEEGGVPNKFIAGQIQCLYNKLSESGYCLGKRLSDPKTLFLEQWLKLAEAIKKHDSKKGENGSSIGTLVDELFFQMKNNFPKVANTIGRGKISRN